MKATDFQQEVPSHVGVRGDSSVEGTSSRSVLEEAKTGRRGTVCHEMVMSRKGGHPWALLARMHTGAASVDVPQNIETGTAIRSRNST